MAKKTLSNTKSGARAVTMTSETPVTPVAVSTAKPAPASTTPSHDEIAHRAQEIYIARGQTPGRELEDWIQAERELLAKAHRNN